MIWMSLIYGGIFLLMLLYKLAQPLKGRLRLPQVLLTEISWRTIGILAAVWILLLGLRAGARSLSDRELRAQVSILSSEIIAFADERNQKMPAEGQPNWGEYTHTLAQLTEENRSLYSQRFAARAKYAQQELARRGLTDKELDRFHVGAANALVIRTVGERLQFLANQLP